MLKFIIIINIIFIIINLFFKLLDNNSSLWAKFKNIDQLIIQFAKKDYINISYLLDMKFSNKLYMNLNKNHTNNNTTTFNTKKEKKIISLYFVNFLESSYQLPQINLLIKILKKKFIVKIVKNNPDYLIYNVFGCRHLQKSFENSIKIAFLTENIIPDFNLADYALGQSHLSYIDRYFKRSYFLGILYFKFNNKYFKIVRKKVLKNPLRKKFCAAVISNIHRTDGFRLYFIEQLKKYKSVDMGGKYKNNVGYIRDKMEFLSSYKFSIEMENTNGDGYLSEKVIQSFLAGTIPIYYGDYMADEYINLKSLILIEGKKDMFKKIEYIKKIDNDNKLYKSILKENIFIDDKFRDKIEKERVEFLLHIFEQNKKKAKRIDNYHFK